MRVLTVVGNRPQFIKSAPLSPALREAGIDEVVLHTGQHYDPELSQVFFEELGLASPAYRLGLETADPAAMRPAIREAVEAEQPDWVLVFGDTNSTLAGAEAAGAAPLAHVEAGLRSFDLTMPEERNRIAVDRLSRCSSAPTSARRSSSQRGRDRRARGRRRRDGRRHRLFAPIARERSAALERLGLEPGGYVLVTVHREANVRAERLARIVEGLHRLEDRSSSPRTRARAPRSPRSGRSASSSIAAARLPRLHGARRAGAGDPHRLRRRAEGGLLARRALRHAAAEHRVGRHRRGRRERSRRRRPRRDRARGRDAALPDEAPPLYGDGQASGRIAAALYA